MAPERILEHLQHRLPHFEPEGNPERVGEHASCRAWRVRGRPTSVVVKAAVDEEQPAEAVRVVGIEREAHSLMVLGPSGTLREVSRPSARPPYLLDYDEAQHVLVMEDIGTGPHLATWLSEGKDATDIGHQLGRFVGQMHAGSRDQPDVARLFENHVDAASCRNAALDTLIDRCRQAGQEEAAEIVDRIRGAVEATSDMPASLVAGRLQPASVYVTPAGLRITDWSAAHVGRPARDVGHLTAYLWMHIHRAPTVHAAVQASLILRDFLDTYATTVRDVTGMAFTDQEVEACALHFGTVLLANAVGATSSRSLYAALPPDSPIAREAAAIAVRHLQAPTHVDMFSVLRDSKGS